MTKERRSVSLDKQNHAYLSQNHVNASGLVNRLLEQYRSGGELGEELLNLRIQMIEDDIDELESRIEARRSTIKQLRQAKNQHQESRRQVIEEAAEQLGPEHLQDDNPAVEHWAEKAGISYGELIEELRDIYEGE